MKESPTMFIKPTAHTSKRNRNRMREHGREGFVDGGKGSIISMDGVCTDSFLVSVNTVSRAGAEAIQREETLDISFVSPNRHEIEIQVTTLERFVHCAWTKKCHGDATCKPKWHTSTFC